MSNFKKILALVCALSMLAGMVSMMSGCKENGGSNTESTNGSTAATGGETDVNVNKSSYTVTVTSAGGLALQDVTILVYNDAALTDMAGFGETDENGQAVISMPASGEYYISVASAPEGYLVEDYYTFNGTSAQIVLTSQLISDTNHTNVSYELGDVMHDFTVTDTNGNTVTLSEMLAEKDMVVLNFWYTTCSYCVQEFPYMDAVYQRYSDEVGIIALNNYSYDTEEDVKYFCDYFYDSYDSDETTTGGLSFPMAVENQGIGNAFDLSGYPTSVVVDRYGVICMIHAGGLLSESYFVNMFEAFTGDNYTQVLYEGFDDLNPVITPDVEMASSEEVAAVLNGGDIQVTYTSEVGDDAEMTWPFIIGEKEGTACLYAANVGIESSYATMYANVTLEKGDVVAFDYFSSSESGADILYILVDRDDVYQISGESTGWQTCYTWVAEEAGEYEIAFCYLKDSSDNVGEDTVYISNLRVVSVDDIDLPTYIPRECATNMSADGFGYENYATVVYNETDGYYHVGTENGPLLLSNLMMSTQFSNTPVYTMAYNGEIVVDGVDYYDAIVDYCSYASNSEIYSLVPVNEELRGLLEKVAEAVGIEHSENEWLQMCCYYDAYGTNGVQLSDPTAGLSAHSAYTAQMGSNSVTYNRVIMPRGLMYRFVPDKSGVYRITSYSDSYTNGWVFTEEGIDSREPLYEYWFNERAWADEKNVSMVLYMEAGKEYFVDIAFYDVYETGTIDFTIEYEAASMDLLVLASPGFFTYYDETDFAVVAGGINVVLGDDGYYHELRNDGSLGSIMYVDMTSYSTIFTSQSLMDLIASGSFNFAITEDDQWVIDYYDYFEELEFNGTDFETCMQDVWGDDFEFYWDYFEVENVLDGIYHGEGEDMTAVASKYAEMVYTSGDLSGCVAVNEELGEVLQMLMDKYTFDGVENSWTKLCYYYQYIGPEA